MERKNVDEVDAVAPSRKERRVHAWPAADVENASRRLRQHPLKQLHGSDKLKVVAARDQSFLLDALGVVLVKRFVHAT